MRRSTYLAPVVFLPVLFVRLVIGTVWGLAAARTDQSEIIVWLFLYALFGSAVVLILGYSYVALINLGFVVLRSWGAFQEDPPTAEELFQNWERLARPEPAPVPTCASDDTPMSTQSLLTPNSAQA